MPLALSVTQSAPSCSEHELLAAVRRGDDRAFEVLYSRYHRRIASYVYGMVGDHGRAEDITQEVFGTAAAAEHGSPDRVQALVVRSREERLHR